MINYNNYVCECGCGEFVFSGNRFIHGHSSIFLIGNKNPAKRLEVRKKISESKMGDNNPMKKEENKNKMKGDKNPAKREDQRDRMRGNKNPMRIKEVVERTITSLKEFYIKNPEKRKQISEKVKLLWKEEYQIEHTGENNANWNGGSSFEPYPSSFTERLKESIRTRDNRVCQICGKTEEENTFRLDVHHIDYDKNNCKIENLISLCKSCHIKTNFSREFWKLIFKYLQRNSWVILTGNL